MNGLYNVSSNPHTRSKVTSSSIMFTVVVALLPAAGYGIFRFGLRALLLIAVTVASAVVAESMFDLITRRKNTIGDFSAIVTGLLLALNLPSSAPWWIGVVGAFFAIIVVKMLFGGMGQNFMNPALGGRCFLVISFAKIMTDFSVDGVASPTPLQVIRAGGEQDLLPMITGATGGTIGETSVIALLVGAAILVIFGIIDLIIPASYIITTLIFIALFAGKGFDPYFLAQHFAGGGLVLGAFFMATDYVTRPISKAGQLVYGIILGLLTGVFRVFGPSGEGVSFSIILGNLLVPLIDRVTAPAYFGKGGKRYE